MQRNRKRDANEPEIIAILEFAGASVYPLDKPLDLLVGWYAETHLLEVKNPDGANRIEPDQKTFFKEWTGRPAKIVRNQIEALMSIGMAVDVARRTIIDFEASQAKYKEK